MENLDTKNRWEKFNLWMYNFLASVLPYSTSFPVAILTAKSAKEFLGLDPYTAGILVFGLEGIGLLCTSLLVDAGVQWIRSKSAKSFVPVLLFGTVIFVYVRILISLNVTLEQATGNDNPALSGVITLLCYIPLLSGVLAGWNKLRIEDRNKNETTRIREEELKERHRNQQIEITQQENEARRQIEIEKIRIQEEQKTARVKAKADALALQPKQVVYQQETPAVSSVAPLSASQFKDDMIILLNETYNDLGKVPSVKQLADQFDLSYENNKGYISTLRKKWAEENGIDLAKKKS